MEDVYGSRGWIKSTIRFITNVEGTTEQSALRDLLTDLRHAANELGLDFEFAVEGSCEVYLIEREEI